MPIHQLATATQKPARASLPSTSTRMPRSRGRSMRNSTVRVATATSDPAAKTRMALISNTSFFRSRDRHRRRTQARASRSRPRGAEHLGERRGETPHRGEERAHPRGIALQPRDRLHAAVEGDHGEGEVAGVDHVAEHRRTEHALEDLGGEVDPWLQAAYQLLRPFGGERAAAD